VCLGVCKCVCVYVCVRVSVRVCVRLSFSLSTILSLSVSLNTIAAKVLFVTVAINTVNISSLHAPATTHPTTNPLAGALHVYVIICTLRVISTFIKVILLVIGPRTKNCW